jgi:two-component system sensor histidine kinase DesK
MLELEKRLSWVYLINLVFYIAPFFYTNYSPLQYLWMTVALVAFVGCYYWVYRSHSSQMLVPILLMALIATVITPLNYGSIAMFAYVSFFIGFAYNFRQFLVGAAGSLFCQRCALFLALRFSFGTRHRGIWCARPGQA